MADPQLFLVVKVMDTRYQSVNGVKVFASFDEANKLPMAAREFGIHSLPFTSQAKKVRVTIDHPGFVPIDQPLKINRPALTLAFDGPTDRPEGPQDINVRNLSVHNRDEGDGINLEVFAILNRLFDVQARLNGVNLGRADLSLKTERVSEISTPILDPGPVPVILSKGKDVTPKGRLFFAQRLTGSAPKLVVMFVGQDVMETLKEPARDKQPLTLPYHLFFHPLVVPEEKRPKQYSGDYPLSFDYVELVERYMVLPIKEDVRDVALLGKHLVHQHEAGAKRPILVFPVGGLKDQMGDLATPENVLNLLFDINYWLQRMLKVPFPLVPGTVAKLAVSGFSAGIRSVARLIGGTPQKGSDAARVQRFFLDEILKEVYSFDGVFSGNKGQAETEDFCRTLLTKWFRSGEKGRVIRLYTTSELWMKQLGPAISPGPPVKGPLGSEEREGPGGTALLLPTAFWRTLLVGASKKVDLEAVFRKRAADAADGKVKAGKITRAEVPAEIEKSVRFQFFKVAHQLVAARFVQHAVANQKM